MIAGEWLARGREEEDSMDSFTSFWFGFNNLFSRMERGNEKDKIKSFLTQSFSEEQAYNLLTTHNSKISYLLSCPVMDMRGNGRNTNRNIVAFNNATTSLKKVQELFMIIYQVRCNLLHGEKSPSIDRDIELCNASAPLVADVVEQNV